MATWSKHLLQGTGSYQLFIDQTKIKCASKSPQITCAMFSLEGKKWNENEIQGKMALLLPHNVCVNWCQGKLVQGMSEWVNEWMDEWINNTDQYFNVQRSDSLKEEACGLWTKMSHRRHKLVHGIKGSLVTLERTQETYMGNRFLQNVCCHFFRLHNTIHKSFKQPLMSKHFSKAKWSVLKPLNLVIHRVSLFCI